MSDDLVRKINRVFDLDEMGKNDVLHQINVGGAQASASRRVETMSYSVSQLGQEEGFTPAEHLEDLLDFLLKEGRWSWRKDHEDSWDMRCQDWIHACLLYDVHGETWISDEEFDGLNAVLLHHYAELPDWFVERVDESRLVTGTASGLTYAPVELSWALDWIKEKNQPKVEEYEDLF